MSARDERLALAEVVVSWGDGTAIPDLPGFLEAATDAVRPLIEADLRERLAAAIEAYADENHAHVGNMFSPCDPKAGDRCDITAAYRHAAHIVRERP